MANRPTLTTAAKAHYRAELSADDRGRNSGGGADQSLFSRSRFIYTDKSRLVVADALDRDEAEALIGLLPMT